MALHIPKLDSYAHSQTILDDMWTLDRNILRLPPCPRQNVRILVFDGERSNSLRRRAFCQRVEGRTKARVTGRVDKNRMRDRTGQSLTKEERICVLLVNVLIALWQFAERIV